MVNINELKCRIFGMGMANPEMRYKKKFVDDIPVMISGDKLVCIPKTREVKHIGIIGMTGSCKSIFMNAQLSFHYHLTERIPIILNDYQKETFEWSMPSDNKIFRLIFSKIGLEPSPMPIIYIFPSTKTVKIDEALKKFPCIKLTPPISEIIKNIESFHDFTRSKLYLGNIKDELIDCDSISEIRGVLEEKFPEKEQKLMRFKMLNIFEDLFNNKVLNVSTPEAPSYLEYEERDESYKNKTIQAIMRARLIPSIQTSDLCNYEFFSAYMSFIINSIYENQYNDKFFKDQAISMFVDEIDKLWIGLNGNIVKSSLGLIGTNGRMARIGLVWATQHYERVPQQIRNNTKYLIVSRQKDSNEVNEIKKDFAIPKQFAQEMLNLTIDGDKGIFEAVCLATEPFVLYDLVTGQRTLSREPCLGRIIPPISMHKKP